MAKKRLKNSLLLILFLSLTGCSNASYYLQASLGQWEMLSLRQPVSTLIAHPKTDPHLKKQLELTQKLRTFAKDHLKLPSDGSFESYVDLKRPSATWIVFATEEFSLKPLVWCFPIAGCLGYRGYFHLQDAEDFAQTLKQKDYDIAVIGSPAYSTLGWFKDSLLNTYLFWPDSLLANLMFHELAHQKLYVADDTAFNESYAQAVGQIGVQRWLKHTQQPLAIEAYQNYLTRRAHFLDILKKTRLTLKKLYQSNLAKDTMREEKKQVLAQTCQKIQTLFSNNSLTTKTPSTFCKPLNNAKLASVNLYATWVSAFLKLYQNSEGIMSHFHDKVERLSQLTPDQRTHTLLINGSSQ